MRVSADFINTPIYNGLIFLRVLPHGNVTQGTDHFPENNYTKPNPESQINGKGDKPHQHPPYNDTYESNYYPGLASWWTHPLGSYNSKKKPTNNKT
ncbi:unnamed protein product [marine sediment metagenome]|uniref:Uncharacterized protein n=1 Tax=marine sediment metagenome TaxID=412755 RepID=X1SI07_9ZZZZ